MKKHSEDNNCQGSDGNACNDVQEERKWKRFTSTGMNSISAMTY